MHTSILSRDDIERRECELLAPYAMKSAESLGRVYAEREHPYRTVYQRDKDRIIYSTAFRRLEYKTQVFVNHEGDYYRTRLTHTLEVAQIARTIARALKLNEELVEAIALVHDVGHTPFGHSGEDVLAELMKDAGGFDHNSHGLRVVDVLEKRYPEFQGLNLTAEVRRGIVMHSTPFDASKSGTPDIPGPWLLEIQVVDIADEIAYDNHDIDDGLKSGLLTLDDLKDVPLWNEVSKSISSSSDLTIKRCQMIREMINLQVSDVILNSLNNISTENINSTVDLEGRKSKIIRFTDDMEHKRRSLRQVLLGKLYRHYRVVCMANKASRFLRSLFKVYSDDPDQLPPKAKENVDKVGVHRAICDHIAGMTDRFALDQYKKFFEPYERV